MPRRKRPAKENPNPSDRPTAPEHDTKARVMAPDAYEGKVRMALREFGAPFPDKLLVASGEFWQHCERMKIDPAVCAATIYGSEKHVHNVSSTTINEAPTREEWEVVIRGKKAEVEAAAKRTATAVRGGDVIFGDFFDDVRAQQFARRMTDDGFVAFYGPRRRLNDAAEVAPVVSEAKEVAPVVSEAKEAPAGHIPWRKVERDPKAHEADMALAERYGVIGTPSKVYELCAEPFSKEDQEVFLVIPVNVRGELKSAPYEVARGQRSSVRVGPDDVMRAVLDSGCEGFIVCHNHPTGHCKPSPADVKLTRDIEAASKTFGSSVTFLDHVVIGTKQAYSIKEKKLYRF